MSDSTRNGAGSIGVAGVAAAVILALATPARAEEPPAPGPADATTPPDRAGRPAPGPAGPGSGASDEDLEAAVLGGPTTAPPPPAAPPRAAPPRSRPAAVPPPGPARPPAAASRERGWPAPARDVYPDEDDSHPALAIELATAGLGSGALQGGLFLGARLPVGLIIGAFLDYGSSSLTVTTNATNNSTEQASSLFRFGAGVRYPVLRSEDGRVELFGAGELGLVRRTREVSVSGGSATNVSAWGPSLAVGPGLRLWVHDHLAIGYVAEFQVTHLSGDPGAFPGATAADVTLGLHAASTDIALAGTFQLLGVF